MIVLKIYIVLFHLAWLEGIMSELSTQLETEKAYKQNKLQLEGVNDKTDVILGDIEEAKKELHFSIDIKTRDFYELQIRQLIKKSFLQCF